MISYYVYVGTKSKQMHGFSGEMNTYWLMGREARVPLSKFYSKSIVWSAPSPKILEGINRPVSPAGLHLDSDLATGAMAGTTCKIIL
jgi:hypothetical protein